MNGNEFGNKEWRKWQARSKKKNKSVLKTGEAPTRQKIASRSIDQGLTTMIDDLRMESNKKPNIASKILAFLLGKS